jgi:hypothetical protein
MYMSQFRWISKALTGSWHLTRNDALCNALGHGQAFANEGIGPVITLRNFVTMEERARVHGYHCFAQLRRNFITMAVLYAVQQGPMTAASWRGGDARQHI